MKWLEWTVALWMSHTIIWQFDLFRDLWGVCCRILDGTHRIRNVFPKCWKYIRNILTTLIADFLFIDFKLIAYALPQECLFEFMEMLFGVWVIRRGLSRIFLEFFNFWQVAIFDTFFDIHSNTLQFVFLFNSPNCFIDFSVRVSVTIVKLVKYMSIWSLFESWVMIWHILNYMSVSENIKDNISQICKLILFWTQ